MNEFHQKLPGQCWFRLVHALFSRWNQQKSNLFSFPPPNPKSQYEKKQVFFRAGVLGQMEEFRDERLGKIMSWMQAWARGYLSRKGFKKLQEQRVALKVVQRNLRKYLQLRTWPWYKLWQKVKPLLNVSRIEDEIAVSIPPERMRTRPAWVWGLSGLWWFDADELGQYSCWWQSFGDRNTLM